MSRYCLVLFSTAGGVGMYPDAEEETQAHVLFLGMLHSSAFTSFLLCVRYRELREVHSSQTLANQVWYWVYCG